METKVLSEERAFWRTWSQVQGLGPVLLKRLATHFGSLAAAWNASVEDLQAVEGVGSKLAIAIAAQRPKLTPFLSQTDDCTYVTPADTAYPTLLYEIPDPPPVLYYQGDLSLLAACQHQPSIGIVGTRSPSEYGKRWTRRLTTALSQGNVIIISGLADGIDREAHTSCLAAQGKTIAVLGTGVDVVYPYRNRDLYAAIAAHGLLVSEYPPGTGPERVHFPRRNRIIAGLSRVTLVAEAPRKSGALITAEMANEYGRDVFVLPGSLDNPRCFGCLELLTQGAHLVLGEETLVHALDSLPIETHSPTDHLPTDLPPHLLPVWQALSEEGRSLDQLVQQLQSQSTSDILSALTHLELMGAIVSIPGTQQYQRC